MMCKLSILSNCSRHSTLQSVGAGVISQNTALMISVLSAAYAVDRRYHSAGWLAAKTPLPTDMTVPSSADHGSSTCPAPACSPVAATLSELYNTVHPHLHWSYRCHMELSYSPSRSVLGARAHRNWCREVMSLERGQGTLWVPLDP